MKSFEKHGSKVAVFRCSGSAGTTPRNSDGMLSPVGVSSLRKSGVRSNVSPKEEDMPKAPVLWVKDVSALNDKYMIICPQKSRRIHSQELVSIWDLCETDNQQQDIVQGRKNWLASIFEFSWPWSVTLPSVLPNLCIYHIESRQKSFLAQWVFIFRF